MKINALCMMMAVTLCLCGTARAADDAAAAKELKAAEEKRTDAYAAQLEAYLRKILVEDYPARAAKAWHRDYSSIEAFLKSVEPNRERWRKVIKPRRWPRPANWSVRVTSLWRM